MGVADTLYFLRYRLFLMGNKKYAIQYIYMTNRIVLNYAIRSQKARDVYHTREYHMILTLGKKKLCIYYDNTIPFIQYV